MNHDQQRDKLKEYSLNTGHQVHYHDAGLVKQQPKVPRNKNPNKIWDGSETPMINARHK